MMEGVAGVRITVVTPPVSPPLDISSALSTDRWSNKTK